MTAAGSGRVPGDGRSGSADRAEPESAPRVGTVREEGKAREGKGRERKAAVPARTRSPQPAAPRMGETAARGELRSCPGLWEKPEVHPSPTKGEEGVRAPKTRKKVAGQPSTSSTAALSCKGWFWHLSSSPAAFKNIKLTWWPRAL